MLAIKKALKSEAGIFDLPSVMTGIIITAIIASITTVSLLVVVPWFQEKNAKEDITAVQIAQNSARQDFGKYVDYPQLKSNNYLANRKNSVCVNILDSGKNYEIFSKAANNKVFKFSSTNEMTETFTGTIPCSF